MVGKTVGVAFFGILGQVIGFPLPKGMTIKVHRASAAARAKVEAAGGTVELIG